MPRRAAGNLRAFVHRLDRGTWTEPCWGQAARTDRRSAFGEPLCSAPRPRTREGFWPLSYLAE